VSRVIVALALLACLLPAARAEDRVKCNDAGSTVEMAACGRERFEAVDRELNELYEALIYSKKDQPVFVAALRKSQEAWLVFRDSELAARFACEHEDIRLCFGSILPLERLSYITELTRERIAQLKRMAVQRGQGVPR
jgi:uncharacterized protein YecT (DUF1311 family)